MVGVSGFEPEERQRFALSSHGHDFNARGLGFNAVSATKKVATANAITTFLVGVSGFEPEASWTRTKRDTKLRHTPKSYIL